MEHNSSFSIIKKIDEYVLYFSLVTQQSANLTGLFQNKVGDWQQGKISNMLMANLTSIYLKNFTNQLEGFEQTNAPKEFEPVKDNLSQSFSNEIKSYESFRDYLISGNETKNLISTDYLSKSLKGEFDAFRSFKDVVNGTGTKSTLGLTGPTANAELLSPLTTSFII